MSCKQCGSQAINHHNHGRDGSDGDLCDVCYWRKRAEGAQAPLARIYKLATSAVHTRSRDIGDWYDDMNQIAAAAANGAAHDAS